MHKSKGINASFVYVTDWKEAWVVFEEATEFGLNDELFSDIECFNARQNNLLKSFDCWFLLVLSNIFDCPWIQKIIDMLFGLLEVENWEGVNSMRINELIKNGNVQDNCKLSFVVLQLFVIEDHFFQG